MSYVAPPWSVTDDRRRQTTTNANKQNYTAPYTIYTPIPIPPGGWLQVTCGLTACTSGSAPGATLGNEYGKPLPFYTMCRRASNNSMRSIALACELENTSLPLIVGEFLIRVTLHRSLSKPIQRNER